METTTNEPPPSPTRPPTEPKTFPHVFHHEGEIPDGSIIKKDVLFSYELGVRSEDFSEIRQAFGENLKIYRELPRGREEDNGLSPEQKMSILAVQWTILRFNGGYLSEHTTARNYGIYNNTAPEAARISDFKEKKAISCVEASVIAQQLLSPQYEMTYVSGEADLAGSGEFVAHTFNLIKPEDETYAAVLLDFANPVMKGPNEQGSPQMKAYRAPLTREQLEVFKKGEALELSWEGETRRYRFGGPFPSRKW